MFYYSLDTEELLEEKVLTIEQEELNLVLYNDDHNTFDWVIECLVDVCGHDVIQAEQCAHIVHFNGKCSVKTGGLEKLRPMCEALLEKGLTAKIH